MNQARIRMGCVLYEADVTFYAPKEKADVAEHREVFDHVGLLVNEPPSTAGLLFT